MNQVESLIGFAIVLLFAVLMLVFASKRTRAKFPASFRSMRGAARLRHAIGLSVEDGTRVHVSLGSGKLIDATNSSALAGLSALDRIDQMASTSDLPSMCTSGNGSFQILSQDVTKGYIVESNKTEMAEPSLSQLAGTTPFSYAVGTIEATRDAQVSANLLIGHFGAEAGLLCDSAHKNDAYTLAGSDSLVGQSIFLAVAEDCLLGEELYALPAYLASNPLHQASLRVQDLFRILIAIGLVISVIAKLAGVI